jgi:tetratricopeptide (TPR) repeat protein
VQGKYAEAKPYAINSIAMAREHGNTYSLSILLVNLIYSQAWLGEFQEAYATLREALKLNRQHKTISWSLYSLSGYAYILVKEGKIADAMAIMGLCLSNPELNSDTRRDIERILQDLNDEKYSPKAAIEQGKNLDLNKVIDSIVN